jgi:hypothetical protein
MTLRLVGAGIGRTGTHSLKLALERLLGAPCYHMLEVLEHPEHIPTWHAAMRGEDVDWEEVFGDFVATVDWPGGAVWREIADAYPDALVLLSTRASADDWWRSADRTIFETLRAEAPPEMAAWKAMVDDMMRLRFSEHPFDEATAKAAYDAHNAAVRDLAPPGRLVEWQPGDGWEPLCAALGAAVPDEPFPHVNTTADFRAMLGLEP